MLLVGPIVKAVPIFSFLNHVQAQQFFQFCLYRSYGISRTPFNLTHVQLFGNCSEEQTKYFRPNLDELVKSPKCSLSLDGRGLG